MRTATRRTLAQLLIAAADKTIPDALWADVKAALVEQGYCPSCASVGHRARLLADYPAPFYGENAGRECPECRDFYA